MPPNPPPDNVVAFRKPKKPWNPPRWLKPWLWQTVVGWVILANVAIYLVMVAVARGNGIVTRWPPGLLDRFGALVPPLVPTEPWRLIACTFLHGDILHIAFNLLIFGFVGPRLEAAFGRARFAVLYLGAALAGSLVSYVWHTLFPGSSIGASGAVNGVIGGLFVLAYRGAGWDSPVTKQYLYWTIGMVVAGIFLSRSGVDHAAHIGGWLGGAGVAWVFAGRRSWTGGRERGVLAGSVVLVVGSLAASLALGTPFTGVLAPKDFLEAMDRYQAGAWAEAEAAAATAIEAHRGDEYESELRLIRAESLIHLGRGDDAKDDLLRAEKANPSASENAAMALLWKELGDLQKARVLAYRAKLVDPRYAQLHEQLKAAGEATPEPEPEAEATTSPPAATPTD